MSFGVSGDAYDRFMGRYSCRLAPALVEFAGVQPDMRALDVGCGPGALTGELVERLGSDHVAAADPSATFVEAVARRFPDVELHQAAAEQLPWLDAAFDAVLAQLVVNFMTDPQAGIREMARVAREGGVVAACTWDYAGGMRMLRTFWDAAAALDPDAPDEATTMRIHDADDLRQLCSGAGLAEISTEALTVEATYDDFDDFWEPFLTGTGPSGSYCVALDEDRRAALREELRRRLGDPQGPFTLAATAWAVSGRARREIERV